MKILLATDGSHFADNAAAFLAHLPHADKMELEVVSVAEPPFLHGSPEVISWIKKNQEAERESCVSSCDTAADMFAGANAKVSCETLEGHPGRLILKRAKEIDADLIVMGAKGHTLLSRMVMGSVSDFVARNAECSVLVVRHSVLDEGPHKELNICVAHDFSKPSEFAVKQLHDFEWRCNTRFQTLSVLALPTSYVDLPLPFDTTAVRLEAEDSLKEFTKSLKELSDDVTAHVIEAEHAGECIVQFALRNETDLIVVGDTGHNLFGEFSIGGVSNFVLHHAGCSVWIARDRLAKQRSKSESSTAELASH